MTIDDLSDIVPTLESFPEFTDREGSRFVDEGGYSLVYLLHQKRNLVGKIPFVFNKLQARLRLCELQKEYDICSHLYENGVSVPKPQGVYLTSIDFMSPEHKKWYSVSKPAALIMEYIDGLSKEESFTPRQKQRGLELAEREMKKVKKLDCTPVDVGFGNFIYQPEQNRVVLIDFGFWERK